MSIQLAVAPIAWSNSDMPELGGDTPLETCLRESREAGFCGTETGAKYPMDAAELGALLAAHELQLASGWFSGRLRTVSVEEEKDNIARQLETFRALGVKVLVYAETCGSVQAEREAPLSTRPVMAADEWRDYGAKLTALAEHMADAGVRMAYHHHMGTVVETAAEVDALMANSGEAVGLTVDTGHLAFAGGDPVALLRKYAARVRHIHCKDLRRAAWQEALRADCSFMQAVLDGVFTVPGDGCIDFHAVARAVADIGYAGWLVVEAEQDPALAPPLQYARMGYRHLRAALAEAGVEITE